MIGLDSTWFMIRVGDLDLISLKNCGIKVLNEVCLVYTGVGCFSLQLWPMECILSCVARSATDLCVNKMMFTMKKNKSVST